MESQIREHHSKLSAQEDELKNLRTEVKKLRQQNHDYQAQRHEDETNIQNFKTQIALLEQEVKNKLELIDKTSQNQNGLENQQRMNEERLEDLRLHNQKLQAKLQTLGDEMMKGNEIIKKQHTQIKELRYKNDMKNMVTVEQEKVLKEKTLQADKIAQELVVMTKGKTEAEEKLKEVTKENEEMMMKIKNNDNCIQWLNKQLNEKQLAQSNPTAHNALTYTRNITNAIGMNSTANQPKFSSTPMVTQKPPTRAAAQATMSLMDSEKKENISPRTPIQNKNSTAKASPYQGIDAKYFSPSTNNFSPIKTSNPVPNMQITTGLATAYLDGVFPRKQNPSN